MNNKYFVLTRDNLNLTEIAKHCHLGRWRSVVVVMDGNRISTSLRLEINGDIKVNLNGGVSKLDLEMISSIEFLE